MPMKKTGVAVATAPTLMIQGYLDGISDKEPQNEDSTYKAGYDLALLVKKGEAEPPIWAL